MATGPPIVRGTAAWKYFGDFRAALLAGQVLMLQVAHPVVAAGVRDHSNYREDPWTRLMRTGASLSIYIYGREGAQYEADRLRRLHRSFKGVDAEGRRYHALDPKAYAWVHATLVKVPVDAQRFFGRALSGPELDEYYAQLCDVGRMLGLRERDLPPDWAAFERYYDEMVAGFELNQTIETLLETIETVRKPFRWLPDPLWTPIQRWQHRGQLFLISATLPPAFRARAGLKWTDEQQRRFDRFAAVTRFLGALAPASARTAHVRAVGRLNVWLRARRSQRASTASTVSTVCSASRSVSGRWRNSAR
ncbi:oxygenase MpaB family protein [Amycolatopsis nigrescens]|uniref:oxygenase MpaB family protein n=1 Tax=Amycolatopsis nigrescens TaxID=381445 RepID=UPI0003616FBA|nr:oxygenase MpaB family protein [Amycolatopsis nigrescens]